MKYWLTVWKRSMTCLARSRTLSKMFGFKSHSKTKAKLANSSTEPPQRATHST